MDSEEATNPVAGEDAPAQGVADEANAQGDDQIQPGTDEWVNEGQEQEADEPGDPQPEDGQEQEPDDTDEIEHEGQKYRVPKPLKDAFLRHADYTRKTQEVAEARRQVEAERRTWEAQQAESRAALPEEYKRVAVLDQTIAAMRAQLEIPDANNVALGSIDWMAFRAQVQANPDLRPIYDDYRARYEAARQTLDDLGVAAEDAKKDLEAKESQRLQAKSEQSKVELAKAQEDTGRVLAREIEGWSQETATKIIQFGVEKFGLMEREVPEMTDPRVWKVLHYGMAQEARAAKAEAALKQQTTANNNAKAQKVQPAVSAGKAAPAVVKTTDPASDSWDTARWMRLEQERLAKQARR